ncbi:MAG: efflux RND transporter permease subunit [Planctomycetota bacterium]
MTSPTPEHGLATLLFRNRHLLWLAVSVILVGGVSAYSSLPRLEDPRIVNRGPLVITAVPGFSAELVEALVTEPLESALDEITAIKDIDSTSRAGVSLISIELEPSVDATTNAEVFAEVRDKVGEASGQLPPEALEPVVDDKRDPAAFTLIVGVTWDGAGEPQLVTQQRLADALADRLRNVPGTELVRVYGGVEPEITIAIDRAELAEIGLTPAAMAQRIGAADAKRPAGVIRGNASDLQVEVVGAFDTLDRVASVALASEAGSVLAVGDVAEVRRGWRTPVEQAALVGGQRSVLVAARVSSDVRVDRWAALANAAVEAFAAERGPGVRIDRVFEQERYTSERLSELAGNLLAGAGVIVAVVLLIMGLRSAIVVASALPIVVSMVMMGWGLLGVGVHQMSIFGLIIALGLLIDNAIVMVDEVSVERARGASPIQAVGGAVRHLFVPLLASTVTTMLAFAPIMLLPGSAGDFVSAIGTSVVLAIVSSFVVAITITATLAGLFVAAPSDRGRWRWLREGVRSDRVTAGYRWALERLLKRPVLAVTIAFALPLAGFAIAPSMGNSFFPPVDRNMFEVRVWTPSRNAIDATMAEAAAVESVLLDLEGVERVDWLVGGSFPSVYYNLIMNQDRSPNYAHAIVTTDSADATARLINESQRALDLAHPGSQVVVRKFGQGPPVVADIEYRLTGPDETVLAELGDRFRVALQAHPDVLHTQASVQRGEPKLFFRADEDAARLAGLTPADLADQLGGGLDGVTAGSIREGIELMPVRVRYAAGDRAGESNLASAPIVTPADSRWLHAASLGDFQLRPELEAVTRFNRERTNTIKAYVRDGALPIDIGRAVLADLDAAGVTPPPGYTLSLGGAEEQDAEANANLATYVPVLAVLMVATLILVFRSVRYALVLGGVAIASVGLGLLSTWTLDYPISFNTILGVLGLIGVALNDSIVVIAAIRADPRAAAGDLRAVVDSIVGSTRHIVATTLTTAGGFLPLLLFVGGDFWPSLAIVFVGGILGATLVALLYVPAMHLMTTWVGWSRSLASAA